MKVTKNVLVVAAVIVCVLAAAWCYGGGCPQKAAAPQPVPAVKRTIAETGGNVFPAGDETLHVGVPAPGLDTFSGKAAGQMKEPAGPPEIQKQPPGGEAAEDVSGPAEAEPRAGKGRHPADPPDGANSVPMGADTIPPPETELAGMLTVTCTTIFDNLDRFNQDKREVLPADGIIYPLQRVVFYAGESVFDLLQREMRKHKIHLEYTAVPVYNAYYIEGINNIYEFDCGELSGWTYTVNGQSFNYGCSNCPLTDGDLVEWIYACDPERN